MRGAVTAAAREKPSDTWFHVEGGGAVVKDVLGVCDGGGVGVIGGDVTGLA